jgi:hypothetical protein
MEAWTRRGTSRGVGPAAPEAQQQSLTFTTTSRRGAGATLVLAGAGEGRGVHRGRGYNALQEEWAGSSRSPAAVIVLCRHLLQGGETRKYCPCGGETVLRISGHCKVGHVGHPPLPAPRASLSSTPPCSALADARPFRLSAHAATLALFTPVGP